LFIVFLPLVLATAFVQEGAGGQVRRRNIWLVLGIYVLGAYVGYLLIAALTVSLGLPEWFPGFAGVLFIIFLPAVVGAAAVRGASSADELAAPPGVGDVAAAAVEASGARRFLTWRTAFVTAVAAFALLAISVSGYMGMRLGGFGPFGTLMSTGFLEPDDVIVLADFADHSGDSLTALAVTQALRVDLSESPAFELASPGAVASRLRRMVGEPGGELDEELAREVAIREGLKAVIAGDINSAGGVFVLSARVVAAETGEWMWTGRENAADSTEIIYAADRLSKRLRERIGESLKSIRGSLPLWDLATPSLEALKKFMQGARAGDWEQTAALWEEAVAIDTGFAYAHRLLGVRYANRGDRAEAVEHLTKAFQHRDRLDEGARYMVDGTYYQLVTGELEEAAVAYRNLLDLAPGFGPATGNLSQIYFALGDYERSAEELRGFVERFPNNPFGYRNLADAFYSLGNHDEAREILALNGGTIDCTLERRRLLRGRRSGGSRVGRWRQRVHIPESRRLAGLPGSGPRQARRSGATVACGDGQGSATRALRLLRFQRHPVGHPERPDQGRPDRALAAVAEYEAAIAPELRRPSEPALHGVRGLILTAEGRPGEAYEELRLSDRTHGLRRKPMLHLGRAYDLAGEADSAIALYSRYVETPDIFALWLDAEYLALVYWRLGNLYEQQGDSEQAVFCYGKLVDLWENADPVLQPRVEAAHRAIQALSPDR
jgi:tetratricopeptide (TPR) repeat protein